MPSNYEKTHNFEALSGVVLGRPGILERPTKGTNSKHKSLVMYIIRRVYKISALARFKPVCMHTRERETGRISWNGNSVA